MVQEYERQVYAAVLGKVAGVYLGRPFEGWKAEAIEDRWGAITRYVHEDLKVPLVVKDDDIAGTFTFVKALSDSGLLRDTAAGFFGKTWLNYLIENRAILWWGGMATSTEHTAWLRLKAGHPSPESGSIALNGRTVAEQIGAQIFIDGFGIVAPGDPALASELAAKAASVSHDGEAVIAAQVVAMLVSMAFVEKKMERLLDAVLERIPADSLIAQIHRDVRAWVREDADWHRTYRRIKAKYGYDRYGGGCHVVPNHALMVMAWSYAQEDFYRAMSIVASAGWDTDCNAGNVGTVSALVAGLDHLADTYDFQAPFADTILVPSADGTDGVTDCLQVARFLAALGRKVMGEAPVAPAKGGATHAFEMAGARHGYQAEDGTDAVVANVPSPVGTGRALRIRSGRLARLSTPVLWNDPNDPALLGTPWLYRGMTVVLRGETSPTADARIRLFTRHHRIEGLRHQPESTLAKAGRPFEIVCKLDQLPTNAITDFGFEIAPVTADGAEVFIESVDFSGNVRLDAPADDDRLWITTLKKNWIGSYMDAGRGYQVTGNRRWGSERLRTTLSIKLAEAAGVVLRWQGLERHYAFEFSGSMARIVRVHYGRTVLAETPFPGRPETPFGIEASADGPVLRLFADGKEILRAEDDTLPTGGAGYLVETGLASFTGTEIEAALD